MPSIIPFLPLIGTAVGAGTSAGVQLGMNKKQIQFARESMNTQRNWALSDWEMVNAYNHPAQQMQRFKEAGLNPHLIYGRGDSGPASMLKTTPAPIPNIGAEGFLDASNAIGTATNQAVNAFFSSRSLENSTALTQAQILKLKSETDKTNLDNDITRKSFDDLVMSPFFSNLYKGNLMELNDAKRNVLPTRAMALEKYLVAIEKDKNQSEAIRNQAARTIELMKLAIQEGKLKQADLDTLETLQGSPMGVKIIFDLLKLILGK